MTFNQSGPAAQPDNAQPPARALDDALAGGPLTPQRCEAILAQARRGPADTPWIQRLAEAMDPAERDHVHRVWVALTRASWYDAFDLLRTFDRG